MTSLALSAHAPPRGRRDPGPLTRPVEPPWPTTCSPTSPEGFAEATSGTSMYDPAERRPVRLIATERYEVWVIGWTGAERADARPRGSAGAFVVTEGELTEVLPGGRRAVAVERELGTGRLRHLAGGTVTTW